MRQDGQGPGTFVLCQESCGWGHPERQACSSNGWGRILRRESGYPVVSHHFSSLPCREPLLGLKSGFTFGFQSRSFWSKAAPLRKPAAHMSCYHLPQRTAGSQRRLKNRNSGGHTSSGRHILCLLGRQLTTRALSFLRLTTDLQPFPGAQGGSHHQSSPGTRLHKVVPRRTCLCFEGCRGAWKGGRGCLLQGLWQEYWPWE